MSINCKKNSHFYLHQGPLDPKDCKSFGIRDRQGGRQVEMNRLTVYSYLIRYIYGPVGGYSLKLFHKPAKNAIVYSRCFPPTTTPGLSFQDLTSALNQPSQIITITF